MKRLLVILLSLLILAGCSSSDKESLRKDFDSYANDHFGYDYFFYEFRDVNSVSLGKGFYVEGTDQYVMYVYPVYENGELTSFYEVTKRNGEFGDAYPSNLDEAVKQLWEIDDGEFAIFVNRGIFYGYAGDKVINFRTNEIIESKDFSGKLPDKVKYDNTERIAFKVPEVKGSVGYLGSTYSYNLSYEDSIRFIKLLTTTRQNRYTEFQDGLIGFLPQYSYGVTVGNERYGMKGYEPLGGQCVATEGYWVTSNPYSELFDFNREMMVKYDPVAFEKVSDNLYELVCANGFMLLSYPNSETFDYENDPSEIDYGVYAAPDITRINEVFKEFNVEEENEQTLSEYFGSFTDNQYIVNTEVECDKFFIKLIGIGERGTFYYIKSKDEKYNTYDGFIIHNN